MLRPHGVSHSTRDAPVSESNFVAQSGLKASTLLSQSSECQDSGVHHHTLLDCLSFCPKFSMNFSKKMQKYKVFLMRIMKLGLRQNRFNILAINQSFINACETIFLNDP